jgi:hypothetical protein
MIMRSHLYQSQQLRTVATHVRVTIGSIVVGTVTRVEIPGREYPLYVASAHDWDGEHGQDPADHYDPIVVGAYDDPEQADREVRDRAPDTATLIRYATGG